MKKQIFTLLILIGLVGFSSKLFAQGTAIAPWEGSEHTYVVDGIANTSTYTFTVNESNTDPTATTTLATVTSGATGTVTAGTATATVQFNSGSVGVNLYVWVVVTTSGCSVPRGLTVVPVAATAYNVNYGILALTTGDNSTTGTAISTEPGATAITDCPTFVGADLIFENLTGSVSNGSSYVYYKITRSSATVPNAQWSIAVTNSGVSATNWVYSLDPEFASSTAFASGNTISGLTDNVVYLRGTLANSASSQGVILGIASGDDTETTVETAAHSANSATLTVTGVPAVGNFGGSL